MHLLVEAGIAVVDIVVVLWCTMGGSSKQLIINILGGKVAVCSKDTLKMFHVLYILNCIFLCSGWCVCNLFLDETY
jgi:hypothetical protein